MLLFLLLLLVPGVAVSLRFLICVPVATAVAVGDALLVVGVVLRGLLPVATLRASHWRTS
jgi:hypothetical protein